MKKTLHFLCSIRASSVSVCIGVLLILGVRILSMCIEDSSLEMSIVLGTVTGILATLILNVSEKYSRSIQSYKALQYNARQFYLQVKNKVSQLATAKDEDYITSVFWPQHFQLCIQATEVLYKSDAKKITEAVAKVICAIGSKEELLDTLENLNQAIGNDV